MNMTLSNHESNPTRRARGLTLAWLLVPLLAIMALVIVYQVMSNRRPAVTPMRGEVISARTLEERYGVRVNLIGVTAGGGLVDLRFKITDAAKAKLLLQDPAKYPALQIERSGVVLTAPEEGRASTAKMEKDGTVVVLFPNSRTAVQRGTAVSVVFGNVQLESIVAQ